MSKVIITLEDVVNDDDESGLSIDLDVEDMSKEEWLAMQNDFTVRSSVAVGLYIRRLVVDTDFVKQAIEYVTMQTKSDSDSIN